MKALTRAAIVVVVGLCAGTLLAQSLGDVARQSRETPRPHAKQVITNDQIPMIDSLRDSADDKTKATEGAADSDNNAAKTGKTAEAGSGATDTEKAEAERKKQQAEWKEKYSQEQEKVSLMEREYKVSEQELRQKTIEHFGDANARLENQEQWARQNQIDQDDLTAKQDKLNEEREKLNNMQEDARHAGVTLPD